MEWEASIAAYETLLLCAGVADHDVPRPRINSRQSTAAAESCLARDVERKLGIIERLRPRLNVSASHHAWLRGVLGRIPPFPEASVGSPEHRMHVIESIKDSESTSMDVKHFTTRQERLVRSAWDAATRRPKLPEPRARPAANTTASAASPGPMARSAAAAATATTRSGGGSASVTGGLDGGMVVFEGVLELRSRRATLGVFGNAAKRWIPHKVTLRAGGKLSWRPTSVDDGGAGTETRHGQLSRATVVTLDPHKATLHVHKLPPHKNPLVFRAPRDTTRPGTPTTLSGASAADASSSNGTGGGVVAKESRRSTPGSVVGGRRDPPLRRRRRRVRAGGGG